MFILIYVDGTDGDPRLESLSHDKLEARIANLKLTPYDYAIIRGEVIKAFSQKSF